MKEKDRKAVIRAAVLIAGAVIPKILEVVLELVTEDDSDDHSEKLIYTDKDVEEIKELED